MKQGKSLVELAKQLEDIRENSRDFLVPTTELGMSVDNSLHFEANGKTEHFEPTAYAHGQVAQYTGVPKAYYERLRTESPALLADNVNHGLAEQLKRNGANGKPQTRLVRAHHGKLRAFLSSSYRRLDSYDLAQTVLPVLLEQKFEVLSSEITDQRMYIKAVTPKVQSEVKRGDIVQYGLVISNSDVGAGTFRVEPLIYRLVCTNGMISSTAIRKFHLGRNMAGDDVTELLTQETLSLTDQAFWAQVKDIVLASMQPERFEVEVNRLRQAADLPIKNFDLPSVVELSMRAVNVEGVGIKDNILGYLANGADGAGLTQWGLINGFTYAAQAKEVSYDQSIEIERAGAKILDLSPRDWTKIAA